MIVAYDLWGLEGVGRLLMLCNSAHVGRILTKFGAVVGTGTTLHSPLAIHNAELDYSHLEVGNHCHLGTGILLDLRDRITIGDCVTISMRAMILTHTDVGHSPLAERILPSSQSPVVIRNGAYLGAGATVLQGVTVGECAVVGAGAVVVGDVPDFTLALGVPARVIKSLKGSQEPPSRGAQA
jgi:acetyltransferase-like isoleucine patch superfamily enzyme